MDFGYDIESIKLEPDKIPVIHPELKIGTQVFINNKEHPLFLEQGEVTQKDHRHYRIKIISQNSNLNNKCIWVPEHWVDPLPKELKNAKGLREGPSTDKH